MTCEAEKAVIGIAILNPGQLDEVDLRPEDFYDPANQKLWKAILALHNRQALIDVVTLANEVPGSAEYVAALVENAPLDAGFPEYAAIVEEKAIRRRLAIACGEVVRAAKDESIPIQQLQSQAEVAVMSIAAPSPSKPMISYLDDTWEQIEHPVEGGSDRVFTGLVPIDNGTFGIEDGRYWLAAAVSGTGKTVVSVNIMRKLPGGSGVLYFCPEQGPEEITNLTLASGTEDIPPLRIKLLRKPLGTRREYARSILTIDSHLRDAIYGRGVTFEQLTQDITDEEWDQLEASRAQLDDKHIWPMSPGDMDIYALRRVMRQKRVELSRLEGPDAFLFVVIDGLGLIQKTQPKEDRVSLMEISQNVKRACEGDINPGAVLVNHHLNRAIFGLNGVGRRKYSMGNLRDAPVENDADVIVFYDRESVWAEDFVLPPAQEDMKFIFLKNRQTSNRFTGFSKLDTHTQQLGGP